MTSHTVALEPTENSRSSRCRETRYTVSTRVGTPRAGSKRTHRDAVPVFVDHHDAEEHAEREEEEAVDVVLDGVADSNREREEDDLRDGEERGAEHDVADRPAVLKRAEDKDELRDDVDDGTDEWPEDVDDPESDGLRIVEPGDVLERGNRDEERYTEHDERRYPEELDG